MNLRRYFFVLLFDMLNGFISSTVLTGRMDRAWVDLPGENLTSMLTKAQTLHYTVIKAFLTQLLHSFQHSLKKVF